MNASGGVLERGAEQFVIRSEGLFTTVLVKQGGRWLSVGDRVMVPVGE